MTPTSTATATSTAFTTPTSMSDVEAARIRDICTIADRVLVDAQRRVMALPGVPARLASDLAAVRRLLQSGIGRQRLDATALAVASWPAPTGPTLRRGDADGLVRAFPSLVAKGCRTYTALEERFADDGACWSSGEQVTAQFVRHVVAREPFDLADAVLRWDERHHAVFLAWARAPWTGY